jgi:hypothetical protein
MGKLYYEVQNVGSAKYVVNYHDGAKTHRDGSPFYDVRIFTNKRVKAEFVKALVADGYGPR